MAVAEKLIGNEAVLTEAFTVNVTLSPTDKLSTVHLLVVLLKLADKGETPASEKLAELLVAVIPAGISKLTSKSFDNSVVDILLIVVIKLTVVGAQKSSAEMVEFDTSRSVAGSNIFMASKLYAVKAISVLPDVLCTKLVIWLKLLVVMPKSLNLIESTLKSLGVSIPKILDTVPVEGFTL